MYLKSALALVAAASLAACSGHMPAASVAPFDQASLPAAVQVPAGHKVVMQTRVSGGDITYECRAKKDMANQFEWAFVGPNARMTDMAGKPAGRYYGPPATWEAADGSKVTGAQLAVAPGAAGSIPLQLVKANPATGMGAMQGISHIQRVATQGGVAPAMACAAGNAGQKHVVTYSADYVFWRAM